MANNNFDGARAQEIARGITSSNVAAFRSAVAFAPGVEPTAAGVKSVRFPSDLSIDASTFTTRSADTAEVTAHAGGQKATLHLYRDAGVWKLDSRGSSDDVVTAR